MENAGAICSRFEQGSALMDGYSQWNECEHRPYVILASDKNNFFRSRFDAAHELGDLGLHRYVTRLDGINFKPIESQAHKFAACFMLPEESFSVELPAHPTLENFITLKHRWGMSAQSMILRAKDLQLISSEDYQRLYKGISARGWRKGEPLDDVKKPESVRLLPRCLNLLLESGIFTKDGLVEKFGFPQGDLEALCSVPKGFLTKSLILDFKAKIQLKNSLNVGSLQTASKRTNVVNLFAKNK